MTDLLNEYPEGSREFNAVRDFVSFFKNPYQPRSAVDRQARNYYKFLEIGSKYGFAVHGDDKSDYDLLDHLWNLGSRIERGDKALEHAFRTETEKADFTRRQDGIERRDALYQELHEKAHPPAEELRILRDLGAAAADAGFLRDPNPGHDLIALEVLHGRIRYLEGLVRVSERTESGPSDRIGGRAVPANRSGETEHERVANHAGDRMFNL